jgi:hypothetical protein
VLVTISSFSVHEQFGVLPHGHAYETSASNQKELLCTSKSTYKDDNDLSLEGILRRVCSRSSS